MFNIFYCYIYIRIYCYIYNLDTVFGTEYYEYPEDSKQLSMTLSAQYCLYITNHSNKNTQAHYSNLTISQLLHPVISLLNTTKSNFV